MPGPAQVRQPAFDPQVAWDLHPSVSVRPEPFGALLYHFGTRRLTFLKDRRLLDVVRALAEHPTAAAACAASGLDEGEQARFSAALGRLAATDMLVPRQSAPAQT
ncbi:MAG TPA: mycofactocin biosynthesis chaperone MftB [Motilibacteraceae bacterium]|nr:mycofactocin biosynthesis chaperone MftB [Motilibacteraceae bacterium]